MKSSLRAGDKELIDFLLLFATQYLASGGPTSRLEDSIQRMSAREGRHSEVFATPTGIFITLHDLDGEGEPKTALMRIRETSTDLGRLCMLERIFEGFVEGRLEVQSALKSIREPVRAGGLYPPWQLLAAAFLVGFAISYNVHPNLLSAFGAGLITALMGWFTNSFLRKQLDNPVFTDFVAAFLTLTAAAAAHSLLVPASIEAYALGGIVMLVPGLALTSAVAELAEKNLVSGTAKFMQATLAFLALGLAYLLFLQLSISLDLRDSFHPAAARMQEPWIAAFAVLVKVSCFGVIFQVPPRYLLWSTLTGLSGWMMLQAVFDTPAAAAGPFLSAVVVGMVSLSFGRLFRQPSQIFSVPGIVALLPGLLAFTSVRFFSAGDADSGIEFSFQVAVTATSIVFGLMTARIPFQLGARYRPSLRNGWKRLWRKGQVGTGQ
jgi:uncharacterized membrane protein YjjP (DUF1212 family)